MAARAESDQPPAEQLQNDVRVHSKEEEDGLPHAQIEQVSSSGQLQSEVAVQMQERSREREQELTRESSGHKVW